VISHFVPGQFNRTKCQQVRLSRARTDGVVPPSGLPSRCPGSGLTRSQSSG
jgi:hypothetical protein